MAESARRSTASWTDGAASIAAVYGSEEGKAGSSAMALLQFYYYQGGKAREGREASGRQKKKKKQKRSWTKCLFDGDFKIIERTK